jgi:hypothetical protein
LHAPALHLPPPLPLCWPASHPGSTCTCGHAYMQLCNARLGTALPYCHASS